MALVDKVLRFYHVMLSPVRIVCAANASVSYMLDAAFSTVVYVDV